MTIEYALDETLVSYNLALTIDLPETAKKEMMQVTKELFTVIAQTVYLMVYKTEPVIGMALMVKVRDAMTARGYTVYAVIDTADSPEMDKIKKDNSILLSRVAQLEEANAQLQMTVKRLEGQGDAKLKEENANFQKKVVELRGANAQLAKELSERVLIKIAFCKSLKAFISEYEA